MPIELLTPIAEITQDEFYKIDERMLGHAFAIHNKFGRLFDELIYKAELADRCSRDGMQVQREVRIRVSHREFMKDYFIDLLLCGSTIVEVKTAKETLNVHHGSLVNFRPSRVVRRFLSTKLNHEMRREFETVEVSWPVDDDHAKLRERVIELCRDIGLGLDLPLYREAIAFLTGSTRNLIPLVQGASIIGHHEMPLLRADVGLAVTALGDMEDFRVHLLRLLNTTRLSGIAWVNLKLGSIHFEHLGRVK
jgi:GxxExxY protein